MLKERDSSLTDTFGEKIVNQEKNKVNEAKQNEQDRFEKMLQEIEPEKMTPLEALNILCQWKKIQNSGISVIPEKKAKKQAETKETNPSLFD
jgi:2-hydroxy-3-keto-5-methylthiopentenyl-1-phosphate phosphatase